MDYMQICRDLSICGLWYVGGGSWNQVPQIPRANSDSHDRINEDSSLNKVNVSKTKTLL